MLGFLAVGVFYDIQRPVDDILVDPTDVGPDHANRDQLDPTDEHGAHNNGRPTGNGYIPDKIGKQGIDDHQK